MAVKKEIYVEATNKVSTFIKSRDIVGKRYYLYAHTRDDNDDIFYVGIGTLDKGKHYYRSTCCKKRNNLWKRITDKTSFTVFILYESDKKSDMLNKEISFISLLGRRTLNQGTLANLTAGGEGMREYSGISKEVYKEIGKKVAEANKNRKITDTTRERLRKALAHRGIISPCKKVIVKDSNSGEIVYNFGSVSEAGRFFSRTSTAISSRIKNNTIVNNLSFEYGDR